MKKGYTLFWSLMLAIVVLAGGCKTKVKPLSERLAKTWTAESVKEGSAVVYTRGGTGNTRPGYSDFRLTLVSGGSSATLVEFDKNSFAGSWELVGETKLTLKSLSPAPTGTGGVIDYTITSINDTQLVLTRTSGSIKTGGTINVYTLTSP
jgi:hypothetical protein